MKKALLHTVLAIAFGILAACGIANRGEPIAPVAGLASGNQPVATPTVPEAYATLKNPLQDDERALSEGAALYQADCSSCHGTTGRGDGPAAGHLSPAPKNLAAAQRLLSDAYLFWRIKEGGLMEPFNSLMPAWKGLLEDEQIWQVILYLRQLRE